MIVTGLNDEVDIKTFTMSNSEQVFTHLLELIDKDVSNLVLGSESMAGGTQSYVGSTRAHENIFRDRVEVYRDYIELVMNEAILPRLVKWVTLNQVWSLSMPSVSKCLMRTEYDFSKFSANNGRWNQTRLRASSVLK